MRNTLFLLSITFLLSANPISAHPGNTAADGCHYCRTNCDSWGVPWNERHCHGGSAPAPVEQYIAPTNPPYIPPTSIPATAIPTKIPTKVPTSTPILTRTLTPTISPTQSITPVPSTLAPTQVTEQSVTLTAQPKKQLGFFDWIKKFFGF